MSSGDLRTHIEEHAPAAIRERLELGVRHSYLKDFVYGAIDGAVTTFAVVSGVAGAELSPGIIIVLGDGQSGWRRLQHGGQQLSGHPRRASNSPRRLARGAKKNGTSPSTLRASAKRYDKSSPPRASREKTSRTRRRRSSPATDERWVDTMLQRGTRPAAKESPSPLRAAAWTTFAGVPGGRPAAANPVPRRVRHAPELLQAAIRDSARSSTGVRVLHRRRARRAGLSTQHWLVSRRLETTRRRRRRGR